MLSTSELDLISESEGRCHCTFGIKTTKLISDKYWGGGGGGGEAEEGAPRLSW